jgi:hypothetical protein
MSPADGNGGEHLRCSTCNRQRRLFRRTPPLRFLSIQRMLGPDGLPKGDSLRVRRHNKKVDIVFRVTEFDFRLEGYAQMLTYLSHNIRETIISEIAVKIE